MTGGGRGRRRLALERLVERDGRLGCDRVDRPRKAGGQLLEGTLTFITHHLYILYPLQYLCEVLSLMSNDKQMGKSPSLNRLFFSISSHTEYPL